MRRYLLVLAVALLAVSIAAPALADVEFLYGGQFRVRYNAGDNVWDGTDVSGYYGNFRPQSLDSLGKPNSYYNSNDNRNYMDQRLRLYFTFVGSPNLKVVTKFEIGDTTWGDPGLAASQLGQRAGQNGGGNIGADNVAIEVKNAYLEFNVPNTPSTGILGIQTITLLNSWIVDDDFSAGVVVTKLDPFRVTLGYIGGQYGAERRFGTGSPPMVTGGFSNTYMAYTNQDANTDDFFFTVDYTCAPWTASLVGFWQDAHKTTTSIDPTTFNTPVTSFTGFSDSGFMPVQDNIKSNDLFDLGFNVTYKVDWLLGYINFVKNFGSVEYNTPVRQTTVGPGLGGSLLAPLSENMTQSDYTGWMVDAGITYFCAPFTFNVGGFYTTGPNFSSNVSGNGNGATANSFASSATNASAYSTIGGLPFRGTDSTNVTWFTYPLATAKYTSEIIGGGVLGDDVYIMRGLKQGLSASALESGSPDSGALGTVYWRGYGTPTNLWTLTTGGSWQLGPGTKLSGSYWYWGTSDAVPVAFTGPLTKHGTGASAFYSANQYQMSDDIGSEVDIYLDQRVVDNLTLTIVGAYLIAGDAFCPLPVFVPSTAGQAMFGTGINQFNAQKYTNPAATDAWKAGARLQWNF
ncbi:MAG: hypothetical protein WAN11_28955 [Syntrophobacteraceae bacterium]